MDPIGNCHDFFPFYEVVNASTLEAKIEGEMVFKQFKEDVSFRLSTA